MGTREQIMQAIHNAVDEVNESLPADRQLDKSPATKLFGGSSNLDSIGLVNLIVATEQGVLDDLGTTITLADEKAMSQIHSPFKTIGSLADYIQALVGEQGSGQ